MVICYLFIYCSKVTTIIKKDLGLWQIATRDHQQETILQAIFVLHNYISSACPILFLFHNTI